MRTVNVSDSREEDEIMLSECVTVTVPEFAGIFTRIDFSTDAPACINPAKIRSEDVEMG